MKIRRVDFYADDWLGGVVELDEEERGVYIQVCALIYSRGGPIGFELLALSCLSRRDKLLRIVNRLETKGKLTRNGETIEQERCLNELKRAAERATNGSLLARKRWKNNEVADAAPQCGSADAINQQSSCNSKDSLRESARARGAHRHAAQRSLADWQPSGNHRQLAYAEGHDDPWIDREADRYRDQQANAKHKHKDFEAGFRNWIRNAPEFTRPCATDKLSAVDKLYLGASRAADAWAERERARLETAEPLLDGGRSSGNPPSSD
jgi:uncharacterized protein YdaU (DUF1376 family)